eukprot:3941767-Rhodomonas_salina.3
MNQAWGELVQGLKIQGEIRIQIHACEVGNKSRNVGRRRRHYSGLCSLECGEKSWRRLDAL